MPPSPRAHVYRLLLVLVLALGAFFGLKRFAVPESWDSANWYRRDALALLGQQPTVYGGNASCASSRCHDPRENHDAHLEMLAGAVHKGLACESCHGSLARHVEGDQVVGPAHLERTSETCLRCHRNVLGREGKLGTFDPEFPIHKVMKVSQSTYCGNCHNPHAPR
jgi:hypothetical protein